MSELTPCNFCSLKSIKRRADRKGMNVTLVPDDQGWIAVYVHPPNVAGFPDNHDGESPQYRVASMMRITDHCVC